jgi:DNA repair protein RecO (recombination protein O)
MKQLTSQAIILARTNYGEADRILTLLTPDYGKLRLYAKGVRRVKSKLAGGIELFSVSQISFIQGRSELGTLVSTRLVTHYGNIVKDIDRTMLGYELIGLMHRVTEDEPEAGYFVLLNQVFEALDDPLIDLVLVKCWYQAQLLRLSGHTPNLQTDLGGTKLQTGQRYRFNFDDMAFRLEAGGDFMADQIKILRLLFSGNSPKALRQVSGLSELLPACVPLIQNVFRLHGRP